MRDYNDEDDDHDYSSNELAYLSQRNPEKYRKMVESNTGKSVEQWHEDNIKYAEECLNHQKLNS